MNGEGSRNQRFGSYEPFADDPSLTLLGATGSIKSFNPTSAQYVISRDPNVRPNSLDVNGNCGRAFSDGKRQDKHAPSNGQDGGLSLLWRSRDNRKGRHALLLYGPNYDKGRPNAGTKRTNTLPATLRGIWSMLTRVPYWDISWWVAVIFNVGSLVWVTNGFLVLLPLLDSQSFREMDSASAWSSLAGGTVYLVGSILLMLEAVNANQSGCFGWTIDPDMETRYLEANAHPGVCEHQYHNQKDKYSARSEQHADKTPDSFNHDGGFWEMNDGVQNFSLPRWKWWPSWRELRSHYFYEIGFIACSIQLVSASLFWMAKFTTLPEVTEHLSLVALDGAHWVPQMVGCLGFILSSALVMVETQVHWYLPAPGVLGWHIGLWKLVGSLGFMISAAFGPQAQRGNHSANFQSSVATFWGSWAICIGSLLQLYECLSKHPVLEEGVHCYSEWSGDFIQKSEERGNASDDVASQLSSVSGGTV